MKNKETNKKPIFKKWWFWLIIVVVAVIAIASSGDSEEQTTTSADSQTTLEAQEEQTDVKEETTVAEEGSEAEEATTEVEETTEASKYDNMDNVYFVGDTLTYSDIEIKYASAETWKGYSSYSKPSDGCKVIRLKFEVKNNSGADLYISTFDFNCYADDAAAEAYYGGEGDLSATVSSGRTTSGYVYFEVPKDAEFVEVEYETNFWTSKKAIFVVE